MKRIPYAELKKGTFLIASPEVNEGIFFRSVVLLCDHSPIGSLGIIINKTLDLEVPKEMLDMEELPNTDIEVRAGGGTQPNQIMLLHSCEEEQKENLQVCDGVYLGGDMECLQGMTESPETSSLLLCLGYSSWGEGALGQEFLSGAWYLHPASKEHVFKTPPAKLWQTLLREMGGKYKTLSMIPENLDLN